jgi:flagellar hook-associated protein 1 FlgK
VTSLSAGITVTSTTSGSSQLPFFVDSGASNGPFTGAFGGRSQLTGFAQRIRVNQSLKDNRAQALVVYSTSPATPQGDATRPQFLVDALTKVTRPFSSGTGIGGAGSAYVSTVTDFARRLVETQGANAEAAKRLDEGQSIALKNVESRFAEKAGVNVDQEMSQLVQLQTAYGANARVLTAIRDMLDLLMRM